MKCKYWFFFLICLIPIQVSGLGFRQVAYIPNGIVWSTGYIKGIDANHDGYQDLIFSNAIPFVVYYGYRPYNRYVPEDSSGQRSLFWDVGDLDGDSLLDVITQRGESPPGIRVFEPASYWTFPKIPVWSWPYEWVGNGVQPMYITDLDQDGLKEILTGDAQVVYVFENRGDNQYAKVYSDTSKPNLPTPAFAYGDFDGDGRMEFVRGTYGGYPTVYLYECTGNDQYQLVWMDTLSTANMKDAIFGPDLDGDGKLEFIFGSCRSGPAPWSAQLWIYEALGNNQYDVIYADSIPIFDRGVYCVHSDCGDVDRDGRPELV